MCWSEKCCYFIPLNWACLILGVINFIISTSLMVYSLTYYFKEKEMLLLHKQTHLVATLLGMDLKIGTVNIILSIITLVSFIWMIFSILLVVGILKHQPSLLLSNFSFGIILTILGQISGLLLLLKKCWFLASVVFIPSLINIHYLVVIHTAYELMQKGSGFRFHRHRDQDEDPLNDRLEETLGDSLTIN
ncbi:unnamed protein product [Arctia plantaginis]|uniref:Uncharacterized protein n=1 Tax=Arctia plantaginis TaxID=874455 RepID=A0A8S0Z6I6_ARCPL|nr:unnamed protein product [Arctia plantaginis]CAB3228275.1 unnamed protein product [Arctia plantaginis]